MKISNLLLLVFLSVGSFAFGQSESELQMMFMGVLEKKGLKGSVDSDGDVRFDYEDHTYFFGVNDGDSKFYRLVLPNLWPIESELERLQVLKAVNEINKTKKVVKAYAVNDDVWITVELFLDDEEDFSSSFQRQLNAMESSVEMFVEEME